LNVSHRQVKECSYMRFSSSTAFPKLSMSFVCYECQYIHRNMKTVTLQHSAEDKIVSVVTCLFVISCGKLSLNSVWRDTLHSTSGCPEAA